MNYKLYVGLFVFLLFLNISTAQLPFDYQAFAEGFEIRPPLKMTFKSGNNYEFQFHIFNISNGYPINSGVSCYFHLYNSTGTHQWTSTDTSASTNFDYGFSVGGGNFSQSDIYFYNVQCNNSVMGGYISEEISVNKNGLELNSERVNILIFVIGFFLILGIFSIYFGIVRNYNLPVKSTFIIVGGVLVLIGVNFLLITIQEQNTNPLLENFFDRFAMLTTYGYYFATFVLFLIWAITFIVSSLESVRKNQERRVKV